MSAIGTGTMRGAAEQWWKQALQALLSVPRPVQLVIATTSGDAALPPLS
jgi:hypothetical protein